MQEIRITQDAEYMLCVLYDAARELKRKGLFNFLAADNTVYADAQLTDDGIIYMEHHFGDKLDLLTQRISSLRAIIFG